MPLYFAYGANMDAAAMALRCPVSRLIGGGHLPNHRFIIMREGYASVVPDRRRTVWGVLWELAPDDIPALDRYEGVAGGLYTMAALPVRTGEGVKRALIYRGCSTAPGRPRPGYLEAVVAAARAAQLPPAYLLGTRHLGPRPARLSVAQLVRDMLAHERAGGRAAAPRPSGHP